MVIISPFCVVVNTETWICLVAQSVFATPWTVARQAPLSVEFSRQEYYWSEEPFPSPGDVPNPGIEPRSPALQADSLLPEPAGKPGEYWVKARNYSTLHGGDPWKHLSWESWSVLDKRHKNVMWCTHPLRAPLGLSDHPPPPHPGDSVRSFCSARALLGGALFMYLSRLQDGDAGV